MKSLSILLIIIFSLSSCITIETTSSGFKDEIYYSADKYDEVASQEQESKNSVAEDMQVESYDSDSEQDFTDEYSSDDYYDYQYSARLRRFHGPSFGFNYYNNYFTNSFWYSNNPYHCGVSIYYGYNFWDPFYYDPFYTHYHLMLSPYYYSNWHAHHHYYHPYNNYLLAAHYYPTYFNSYDNNSIYYGPRIDNKNKTPERFARLYKETVKNNMPSTTSKFSSESEVKSPSYYSKNPSNTFFERPLKGNKINSSSSAKTNTNIFSKPNKNNSLNKGNNYYKPENNSPSYSQPKPNNSKPAFSKPSYNKPKPTKSYSRPKQNTQRKPSYNKSTPSPSNNKSYSSPSRSYTPRGGSGKRPR